MHWIGVGILVGIGIILAPAVFRISLLLIPWVLVGGALIACALLFPNALSAIALFGTLGALVLLVIHIIISLYRTGIIENDPGSRVAFYGVTGFFGLVAVAGLVALLQHL